MTATTTVAALGLCFATTLFLSTSYASTPRPTPTPHATVSHSDAPEPSRTHSPLKVAAVAPSRQSGSWCSTTTAVPHNPIKVGSPDAKSALTDRTFTLNTNCGQIAFKAWGKKAPATVIAMTFLAKSGFFDHSLCHRLTTAGIFVLQCGDPTASGSGGPMWSYRDENLPANGVDNYPAGTIAMANSGPNTNGSQFFIVYKDTTLPPSYSIWGVVTKGLDVVKKIATAGVVGGGTDGTPKQTIAIESVNVK